jgi:hypothetical protein
MSVAFGTNRYFPRAQPAAGSGPVTGDSLLAVPNIAALVALDDTTIDDGGVVSVKSVLDLWMLDKTSPLVPDGITVVAAPTAGNWVRMLLPSLTWQLQTTWYINEGLGNDENTGVSSLAPLATWAEYSRRVGEGPLTVSHTVNFVGLTTQDIHVNTLMIDDSVDITLQGVRSAALYSGSVTGLQAQVAATNTDLQVTDAAIPVSWTASGLVDKLYVLTSGPNTGAAGWVVKDVGGKTARLTKAYNEGAGTYVEPGVAETFDVVDLGFIEGALRGINGGNLQVVVRDLRFLNAAAVVFETQGGDWSFVFSDIEGGVVNLSGASQESSFATAVSVTATRLQGTSFILNDRSTVNFNAAYLASGLTMRSSGVLLINWDSVMQYKGVGAGFGISAVGQSRVHLRPNATFGVFDLPGAGNRALRMSSGGTGRLQNYLWGYGNTFDYAIEVHPHSAVEYDTGFKPVVVAGALNDTIVGGLPRAYVTLPSTNVTQIAGIVVR